VFEVIEIDAKTWSESYSEFAHAIGFGTVKKPETERIDFAMMGVKDGLPMGYITCHELDSKTVYWQFGAPFPGTKGTINVYRAYEAGAKLCLAKYDKIVTYIGNHNISMLKMAMQVGFRITGIRVNGLEILVEHTLLKGDKDG
jgi:hypothetical protein